MKLFNIGIASLCFGIIQKIEANEILLEKNKYSFKKKI